MSLKKDAHLRKVQGLTLPLTRLKGIGPKRAALLTKKGIYSILDLLFFTPIRYEDRTRITPIIEAEEGRPVLVRGTVLYGREERFRRGKGLFKILIRDNGSHLELLWFHYRKQHLSRYMTPDKELLAYGSIQMNRGKRQMIHPDIIVPDKQGRTGALGFYPVYSAIKGVSVNILRKMIRTALEHYSISLVDPVPEKTRRLLGLSGLVEAIRDVHFPDVELSIDKLNRFETPSHRRLIFDRFFLVMLTVAFTRRSRERKPGPVFRVTPGQIDEIGGLFPFRLTQGQREAIEDIVGDFSRGRPMNRLIMGDVGCGKTVVAAVAAHITARNDMQVAVMVPTQILADQHMNYFSSLSLKMGFRPVLLTGKLKAAERRDIYEKIGRKEYNIIIGTQSLIQEGLSFSGLGLVIIDEQHRFGVRERALMERKGKNPHLLVMTATPIPRTLAITVYGDMDISIIKEYPDGHKQVVTKLVPREDKRKVSDTLNRVMSSGRQVIVICPLIEASEEIDLKNAMDMAEKLKKLYSPSFRIGLIHGRLPSGEREKVMDEFRRGMIHLLVGTTVIEVGVHVPGAAVMVIEHPERFGLAQLHQLRGRIGRGSEPGLCLLMQSEGLQEKALARLRILVENHDGFEIAQKDLEMRGQGELTGMRQAGFGELDFTEMMKYPELLVQAGQEARRITGSDPELLQPENGNLKTLVNSVLVRPLDL